jgi:tetratricopeptide (TPR) repeat protein
MVDRNSLLNQLKGLLDSQLEELIFRLNIDAAHLQPGSKNQRSMELIKLFEQQKDGLQYLQDTLDDLSFLKEATSKDAQKPASSKLKVPFVLPKIDIDTFTGRIEEIEKLKSQLLGTNGEKVCSIVGLSGGGGMGKSALAFHFATVYRDRFPDGVIGLPVDGKAVHEVAREFARFCGEEIDEEDDRSASTIMQEVFAHRRMLLIFDNADRAELKSLRPGGQRCALIVTTRDRQLPNSFEIPNTGAIDLSPLPDDDARKLLRAILGAERVDTELTAANQIIKITGGLPLALQIAGSALRGRQRSLASYAESLQAEHTQLQRLQVRGDLDLNVKASLNLSLELLDEPEIDLFACLSVCAPNGFSLQTAMVAGGLADEWEVQELVDRLYQLSLLNEVSPDRYMFHALVRVYAQEYAQQRNLGTDAAQRHARFFIDLIQVNDVESPEIAKQLTEDFDDILQAAQWLRRVAVSDEHKKSAYQFALDLRPFLLKYNHSKQAIELMTGFQVWAEQLNDWYASVRFKIQQAKYLALEQQFSEAETVLRNAQGSIDQIDILAERQESQAKQLSSLAGVLQKQEKFDEAILVLQRQIEIEEALNDQSSLAISLNRLGRLWQQQGNTEAAIAAFERQIGIAENLNYQKQLAIGLNCLGRLWQQQGNTEAAIAVFERQIRIVEALNDQRKLAIGLNRLGGLWQQQGNIEAAITTFEREIVIDRELVDQSQLVIGLNCLGRAFQKRKDLTEAISTFKEQIEIAKILNDQKQMAIGWSCLGAAHQDQENFDEAIVDFQNEIRISHILHNRQQLVFGYNHLGEALRRKGDLEAAVDAFNQSIEIAKQLDDKVNWAIGLDCLGSVLRKQDRLGEASIAFEEEISIAKLLSNLKQLAIGWNSLGEVSKQQGYLEKSVFSFLHAASYNDLLKDNHQLHSVWKRLGDILRNKDDLAAANSALQHFDVIVEDVVDPLQVAITLHVVGKAYSMMDRLEEAEIVLKESQERLYDLNNHEQLLKILKTLVETFEKKQDWYQAEHTLRLSYNEAEKLKDISTTEKILRKLGEICSKQESEEKLKDAQGCFRQSIKLSREMNNPITLAQAYKAWGDSLNNLGKSRDAVSVLIEGFEELIHSMETHGQKSGKYVGALGKVAKILGYTLVKLRRREEALEYCDRALAATDNHPKLVQLRLDIATDQSKQPFHQPLLKHKKVDGQAVVNSKKSHPQ